MDFIFSTGSLYTYSLSRVFNLAAKAGFDGVELMVDQRWDTRQPDYVQSLMDRYGLPVVAVHSPFGHVPGWPREQSTRVVKSIKLAKKLGARIVVHHLPARMGVAFVQAGRRRWFLPTFGWNGERAYRDWLLEEYPALQEKARRAHGITLCIENMPARQVLGQRVNGHCWNRIDEIVRFPALTMDTTHLGTWGLEPVEVYAAWGGQVRHVHFSNFDGREHRRPERGHLKLDALLARLAAAGYAGAVSFELHPDAAHAGSTDEHMAELLAGSLALSRDWAKQTPVETIG